MMDSGRDSWVPSPVPGCLSVQGEVWLFLMPLGINAQQETPYSALSLSLFEKKLYSHPLLPSRKETQ